MNSLRGGHPFGNTIDWRNYETPALPETGNEQRTGSPTRTVDLRLGDCEGVQLDLIQDECSGLCWT